MVLDEVHLTDKEVSKLFDVVIDELKAERITYGDILNFDQPFNQVVFIITSGERYPAHYVYKLNKKKGMLSMYCYYLQGHDEEEGRGHNYACNGDERFSYFWDLRAGRSDNRGYIKAPDNEKILDIMQDSDIQKDFRYTFFIVNWFIKNAKLRGEAESGAGSGGGGSGGSIVDVSTKKVTCVEAVRDKKARRGGGSGVRYKNVVYVSKVYSFSRVGHMSKSELRKEFRCLCWGVRGHFRHVRVRGGVKTVFVRPYLKGKKRREVMQGEEGYYVGKKYKM